jgi:hypothetical protein
MCQTLAQGGKRCDTHKDGSKATVSLTSRIADISEKIVRKVFGDLKKEGKGLEAPEKEEVVSYAETGKFLTKYNPDIPERQKKTLMNQFEKSKEEDPSGPLFHAWKHTLPETLRRGRKTFGAIGVAGVIMATSACGPAGDMNNPAPSPSVTISAEANSTVAGTVVNGIQTKKELANDGKVNYVQTSIADSDFASAYNPLIVTDIALKLHTPEELAEGQKVASRFVTEEVIDSTLNDNPSDQETINKWVEKNRSKFDPEQIDGFIKSLQTPAKNLENPSATSGTSSVRQDTFLIRGSYREGKYTLVNGNNQTRVLSRTITPTAIRADTIGGKPYVEYESTIRVAYGVKINGVLSQEIVTGTVQTTLRKDPASGNWLIAGATNKFDITPAS